MTATARPIQPAGWLHVTDAIPGDTATHPDTGLVDEITGVHPEQAGLVTLTWAHGPATTIPTDDHLQQPLPKPGWQPPRPRPVDGPRHDAADFEPELRPLRRNVPRHRNRR